MDPLSATASIGSILELIAGTVSVIHGVCRDYKQAPAEIRRLRVTLGLTQSTAVQIQALLLAEDEDQPMLGQGYWESIQHALQDAERILRDIYAKCHAFQSMYKDDARSKLLWAIKNSRRVHELLGNLESLTIHLSGLTNTNTLGVVLETRKLAQSTDTRLGALESFFHANQTKTEEPKVGSKNLEDCTSIVKSRAQAVQLFNYLIGISAAGFSSYGYKFDMISSTETSKTRELVSYWRFSVQLTFPTLFGTKALQAALSLSFDRPWYYTVDILSGHLRVNNVVPQTAEVMEAAKRGDVDLVRRLITRGLASIRDITPDARPLLWYAVDSGSFETVEYLVTAGADVKALTGPYHTELLSRAFFRRNVPVSRLLLRAKVDLDHVNSWGMTPVHHLFQKNNRQPVSKEIFSLLPCHGYTNLNVQDEDGETPLHRAASHGTASDIQQLLKLGAEANVRMSRRGWTPIFCAAYYDNVETFTELANVGSEDPGTKPRWFTNEVDERGWTLLHVAADKCSTRVTRILLEAGADPFRLSRPSHDKGFCEEVAGQMVSPLHVARHRGPEAITKFEEQLRGTNHDTHLDKEGDVFWELSE